ncbi:hypothetical protein CATMIT_01677 [Catenibacterium mitsuokai DSM 15897]|nr:hypothetical protein CATMIT_01677 [Catenibacterium mitsuokai DSM 15897]
MAVCQHQRFGKQVEGCEVIAHVVRGRDHSDGLAQDVAKRGAQPLRVFDAAQSIDEHGLVAVDEGGSDGFDLVADEHQHLWSQFFNTHGSRLTWVANPRQARASRQTTYI